jgi:hypothetical protein
MKTALEKALYEKYPELYRRHDDSSQVTSMCWGFQCGDGWYNLLDDLSAKITLQAKGIVAQGGEWPAIEEVRQDSGCLRVTISGGNDTIDDLITEAEMESTATCELCGSVAEIPSETMLKVLCTSCEEKYHARMGCKSRTKAGKEE